MTDQQRAGAERTSEKDTEHDPGTPPEQPTEKEPQPSKGSGPRRNVQLPPDKQRGAPDPKRKSPTQ